ncbi:PREDICTED: protein SQS1-like [Nicotiana attenuata]|uniref:protein SQS1-like n=1 Tax=Nicotiana attenuata TaxID=49451 RepID=UPI0009053EA1|nr:PREDICTED: protein SQS1-like [Nicotiana attenuata]
MKYQSLLQSVARFLASKPIKIFTQLLVSVSLFSFLFSYSSSYFSFLTHSLKFSYSAFPFQLVSHVTDKNYVFLICNGIFLVLLAKTSSEEKEEEEEEENGFLNELQLEAETLCNTSNEHVIHEDKKVMIQLSKSLNVENSNSAVLVEYNKKEATSKEEGGFGDEECCRTYNIVEADYNNYEEKNEMESHENGFLMEDVEVVEEEEENDEPLSKLSTEELNKKFEEFIRRMKEEIRIEARQQLILVK